MAAKNTAGAAGQAAALPKPTCYHKPMTATTQDRLQFCVDRPATVRTTQCDGGPDAAIKAARA